eukprot:759001-Hanusia_phi.AAC.5
MVSRFAKFVVKARQPYTKLACMELVRLEEETRNFNLKPLFYYLKYNTRVLQLVKLLIEHKANVNAASGSGMSCFECALRRKNLSIIDELTDNGLDLNLVAKAAEGRGGKWTALHVAADCGSLKLCRAVIQRGLRFQDPEAKNGKSQVKPRCDIGVVVEKLHLADSGRHCEGKSHLLGRTRELLGRPGAFHLSGFVSLNMCMSVVAETKIKDEQRELKAPTRR